MMVAYTWRKFIDLKRAGDPNADMWPLRLPMVKAVVRAMDATEDFLSKCDECIKRPDKTTSFITMGASKRGWTTWLTGAVDKRVIAMAPIVMDAANQHKLLDHGCGGSHGGHHWRCCACWDRVCGNDGCFGKADGLLLAPAQRPELSMKMGA